MGKKSSRSIWLEMPLRAGWAVLLFSFTALLITGITLIATVGFFTNPGHSFDGFAPLAGALVMIVEFMMLLVSLAGVLLGCMLIFIGRKARAIKNSTKRKVVKNTKK